MQIKLLNILNKQFKIDKKYLVEEFFDIPLTGRTFNFDGIDMIYLLHYVNLEYDKCCADITIEELRNEFNTINQILSFIDSKQLKQRSDEIDRSEKSKYY